MRIVRVAVVGVIVAVSLSGCAAKPALSVAGGIHFCVADPDSRPVGFAIDTRNTGSSSLTIDRVTARGTNITPGKAWLLPAHSDQANGIGSLVAPFDSDPDGISREVVSRGTLAPGKSIAVVATASIPFGGISAASLRGVDIDYTTADGSKHTAHSSVTARFKAHC
jgi:hypothetical protein